MDQSEDVDFWRHFDVTLFARMLFSVFATERYLAMKHLSNSQSSQPTAFMNHLMTLSNQTQV